DHVVGGFDSVKVVLNDGRELDGKVIRAEDIDLAVVKVDATDLPTLPFGDSSKVRPGQFSMAVGSPFGLDNTVTFGHISALGRTNQIRDERLNLNRDYPDLIQTDTAINMGNSGGPLVNVRGEVIGINTAIFSPSGMNNGIGFAIPSNTARLIADKLITDGKVRRGAMGLLPQTLPIYKRKELGVDGGASVQQVVNGTPAAIAGIKQGDVIVRIGNIPVKNETDVRDAMLNYAPGEKVEVEVVRDKQSKTFTVALTSLDKLPQGRSNAVPPAPDQNPLDPGHEFNFPDVEELRKQFEKGDGSRVAPLREGEAKLGISVQDLNAALREQFHIPTARQGVLVTSVAPSSVAEKIGLKPGDLIEEIGGTSVASVASLKDAMKGQKWGDQSTIKFSRYTDRTSSTTKIPFTF
ncbi:MAG: serine protease Do, partial [Fimbriimonadaceae bacterium]|nr:serine protease Do [Fimbriimonadaceae bacterium]